MRPRSLRLVAVAGLAGVLLLLWTGRDARDPGQEPAGVGLAARLPPVALAIAYDPTGPGAPIVHAPSPPPDVAVGGRALWFLDTLFGVASERPDAVLDVQAGAGDVVQVANPAAAEAGRRAALVRDERGEASVAWVDPDDPLPAEEAGRAASGGRRVAGVTRLVVRLPHEVAFPRPPEAGAALLDLTVHLGARVLALTPEDLGSLPTLAVPAKDGRETRAAWSLRDLAARLGGAGTVVTRVRDGGGLALEIAPEAWADEGRVPVLRLNRAGLLKFQWVGADLQPLAGDVLRGVRSVEIRAP